MLTRRVIPCIDVHKGRVVKGVNFNNLVDVGDPVERAARYMKTGADELCFLDVTATTESRSLSTDLVEKIARALTVPFTVGGGIRTVQDARAILRAGADKVALNTAAVLDPHLLTQLANEFGQQCVVISIDTRKTAQGWMVTTQGGKHLTSQPCIDWAEKSTACGAGEVLLNVIDTDGTRSGFALDITRAIVDAVNTPVIASGGGAQPEHFAQVFQEANASAALAASIFHDDSWTPDELKEALRKRSIEVRL